MGKDQIGRYIWIIDTLSRYKRLSREELNRYWRKSQFSNGQDLPERTFYHYRRSIEEIFNINLNCDSTGRYYIDEEGSALTRSLTNCLLETATVNSVIQGTDFPADRVEIEDVPSAREFLPLVVEAIRDSKKLDFTYAGFSRSRAEAQIIFQPYFLKRYKQRWYMIGLKEKGNTIRTYALDRIKDMTILGDSFEMPGTVTLKEMFSNIVGVTTSQAQVKTVRLKTTTIQAKYFRALPLHPSQDEEIGDNYSIFTYKLKLNYELVHEILSLGDAVKVLSPPELKAMVVTQLKDTLQLYEEIVKGLEGPDFD